MYMRKLTTYNVKVSWLQHKIRGPFLANLLHPVSSGLSTRLEAVQRERGIMGLDAASLPRCSPESLNETGNVQVKPAAGAGSLTVPMSTGDI